VNSREYSIEPKIGFLQHVEQAKQYAAARNSEWFHEAITHAMAQMCMKAPDELANPMLVIGARLFIRELMNLDVPDQPNAPFRPLRPEV
jgi:hypothetical protein